MTERKKYNIEHRKERTQWMMFEEIVSWVKRNRDEKEFKSESEFATHLMSLGIQAYQKERTNEQPNRS